MAVKLATTRPAGGREADRAASELRKIRLGCTALGIGDDARRDLMQGLAGVRSSKDLTAGGRAKVLKYLTDQGAYKVRSGSYPDGHPRKARAMWIKLARDGVIRNGSDAALDAFVKRVTRQRVSSARFLIDPAEGSIVIEALKAIVARARERERSP